MISDEMLNHIATLEEGQKSALDDHEQRIAELEAKIEAPHARLAALAARIAELEAAIEKLSKHYWDLETEMDEKFAKLEALK